MSWLPIRRRQAGDTLVEVVMSLAILATVLVTSFNVANLSYRLGVQAREHTQATNLAQDQMEKLTFYRDQLIARNVANNVTTSIMTGPPNFPCGGGAWSMASGGALGVQPVCSETAPAPFGGVTYHVAITGQPNVAQSRLAATVTVTWDSLVSTDTGKNTAKFDLILVDKQNIVPRNCDVVGQQGGTPCQ